MNLINSLKMLSKLAIPACLLLIVSAGIVLLARSNLGELEKNTKTLVEVSAARAVIALQMGLAVDEATIFEKNIIIETDDAVMRKQHDNFKGAKAQALSAVDHLITLSDTPERRSTNEGIKGTLGEFFAAAERSIAAGLANQNDAAAKISSNEVRPARTKTVEAVAKRVEASLRDLQAEKAEASAVTHSDGSCESGDSADDLCGWFVPGEGPSAAVVLGNVALDGGLEIDHAREGAAS